MTGLKNSICAHTNYSAVYFFQFKFPLLSVVLCFQIPVQALVQFVEALEIGYSKYKNPYHNLIHAADVTQTAHFLMLHTGLMVTWQHSSKIATNTDTAHCHKDSDSPVCLCISIQHWLSELEILAMVFAAAIHDFEHTGTTNNFHIHTRYCTRYTRAINVTQSMYWFCISVFLATLHPIKIFCRSNILNYSIRNIYSTLQAFSLSYACLSGQRWPFCTMTGQFWRTITWALPTDWWWRRTWTYLSTWTRMTGGEKEIHHVQPEAHSYHTTNDFDCMYETFWQGAEDFGDRDGDVHWHVLSLPANQDHEECPHADRQVRTESTAFQKSSHSLNQFDKNIDPTHSSTLTTFYKSECVSNLRQ